MLAYGLKGRVRDADHSQGIVLNGSEQSEKRFYESNDEYHAYRDPGMPDLMNNCCTGFSGQVLQGRYQLCSQKRDDGAFHESTYLSDQT